MMSVRVENMSVNSSSQSLIAQGFIDISGGVLVLLLVLLFLVVIAVVGVVLNTGLQANWKRKQKKYASSSSEKVKPADNQEV